MQYQVNEIYRTIQGEGYWTGMPCTLVRLQGCDLGCPFCDTKYTWDPEGGTTMALEEIVEKVKGMHFGYDIILLTGGEPAMQPLKPLVEALQRLGLVHLETSGAYPVDANPNWLTVSPKLPHGVASGVLGKSSEIKWLVGSEEDVAALLQWLRNEDIGWDEPPFICLQPLSQDPLATKIAYEACLKHGWRLSLQIHQYIGVR